MRNGSLYLHKPRQLSASVMFEAHNFYHCQKIPVCIYVYI